VAFDCKASTKAPLTAAPSLVRVTVPLTEPVPTENVTPLLDCPPTVTTTDPVDAPEGTAATILVGPQLVGLAATPLKVTVFCPCDTPKFDPEIVTVEPVGPDAGKRATIAGATANDTPLLEIPPTVTNTRPVVAPLGAGTTMPVLPQLDGIAGTPLNVTVLLPWVAPKPEPEMVTEVPAAPDVGFRLVIPGPTVKLKLLLGNPATVTMTGPEVTLAGTGVSIV